MFSNLIRLNNLYNSQKSNIIIGLYRKITTMKAKKLVHKYIYDNNISYKLLYDFCSTCEYIDQYIKGDILVEIILIEKNNLEYYLKLKFIEDDILLNITLFNNEKDINITYSHSTRNNNSINSVRFERNYEYEIQGDSIKDIKIKNKIKDALYKISLFILETDIHLGE